MLTAHVRPVMQHLPPTGQHDAHTEFAALALQCVLMRSAGLKNSRQSLLVPVRAPCTESHFLVRAGLKTGPCRYPYFATPGHSQ